jgi:hypothetical protein
MAITGLSNSEHFANPDGRKPQDWQQGILHIYPTVGGVQKAPLTALTAAMRSSVTTDPTYNWFEKSVQTRRLVLSGAINNSVTSIGVAGNATSIHIGTLLLVEETGEILRVTATPANDTTLVVTRGFAGSSATAVTPSTTVNPFLVVVGTAFEENSVAPPPVQFDPTHLSNHCQIFRATYGLSATADVTTTRSSGTGEMAEAKRDCLENFTTDMERAWFFGKKSVTTVSGNPLRTTAGVISRIPADNKLSPVNGIATMDWWEQTSERIFAYGSSEKLAFCGPRVLTSLNAMLRKNSSTQFEMDGKQKEYGMDVRRLFTPHGTLVLKPHPLFAMMGQGASGTYKTMSSAAVILDMDKISYRHMKDRNMKHMTDMQTPGQDGKLNGFIAECGLQVKADVCHFMVENVVSGGKDA